MVATVRDPVNRAAGDIGLLNDLTAVLRYPEL